MGVPPLIGLFFTTCFGVDRGLSLSVGPVVEVSGPDSPTSDCLVLPRVGGKDRDPESRGRLFTFPTYQRYSEKSKFGVY